MNQHQLILAVNLFIFGVSAKYADLYNEHGLPEKYKGISYLAGIIWGVCGVFTIFISPIAGLSYIAHVLYWFHRVKLEYSNHALAGVMILLAGFYFSGNYLYTHRLELVVLYLLYLITGYLNTYLKNHYSYLRKFLRLRLRIYLIPFAYTLYTQNLDPILATLFGMLGTEIITCLYSQHDVQNNRITTQTFGEIANARQNRIESL